MAEHDDRRLCPTRESGTPALIAHWITPATCGERQRRNYHKCFSCRYRGLGPDVRLPEDETLAPLPAPPVPPERKPRERKKVTAAT